MTAADNPFDLSGRTAVVTGGGRGIGLAVAQQLTALGATVLIAGRSVETLEQAAAQIGAGALWQQVDVASERSVLGLRDAVRERLGRLDILVNNAGVNPFYKRTERTSVEEWSLLIDVNLTGVFLCVRHLGTLMLGQGRGSIISITSIASASGLNRSAAYCATKAGVEAMTRSVAHDWASQGVRVNCVAPGYVATDLTEGLEGNRALLTRITARTPMARFARPAEVCGAVSFLASDASSYVTGTTVRVDGGWTAA